MSKVLLIDVDGTLVDYQNRLPGSAVLDLQNLKLLGLHRIMGRERIARIQIVRSFRRNPDGFQESCRTGIRQAASGRLPRFDQMHTLNRKLTQNRPQGAEVLIMR